VVCVWHIRIVPRSAAADILAEAIAGDAEAKRLLAACSNVHRRINVVTEPNHATTSCMICDTGFWRGHAPEVIVLVAEYDNDDAAPSTFVICADCFAAHHTAQAIKAAVLAGYSAALGEPLRQLPLLVAMTGHA
jgi:hypothetical protein